MRDIMSISEGGTTWQYVDRVQDAPNSAIQIHLTLASTRDGGSQVLFCSSVLNDQTTSIYLTAVLDDSRPAETSCAMSGKLRLYQNVWILLHKSVNESLVLEPTLPPENWNYSVSEVYIPDWSQCWRRIVNYSGSIQTNIELLVTRNICLNAKWSDRSRPDHWYCLERNLLSLRTLVNSNSM